MKSKSQVFVIILAFLIRFVFFIMLSNSMLNVSYIIGMFMIYFIMLRLKFKPINYVPTVMIDFILSFYFVINRFGMDHRSVIISLGLFVVSNSVLYGFLINNIVKQNSNYILKRDSNYYVDKGIKALEKDNQQEALEFFKQAIKDHKKNYLGYMGMCNTLSKYDKKNLRRINYYKKKCIKYAPKELKESINDKF